MYFPFAELHGWDKRSAGQPQTIYSEFPQECLMGQFPHEAMVMDFIEKVNRCPISYRIPSFAVKVRKVALSVRM